MFGREPFYGREEDERRFLVKWWRLRRRKGEVEGSTSMSKGAGKLA